MTAEPHGSPVAEEVRSLEVRWIFPGPLETTVAGWFGRFLAESQSREDTYLADPRLRGLSVKVRGGRCPGGEGVGVVLCYFSGRLARKFAYQALPIDGLYSGRHLGRGHQGPSAAAPKTS